MSRDSDYAQPIDVFNISTGHFCTIDRIVFHPTLAILAKHPSADGCVNYLGRIYQVRGDGRSYALNEGDEPVADTEPLRRLWND